MNLLDLKKPLPTARLLQVMTIAALLLMTNKTAAAGAVLNWQTGPGYRWRELPVPAAGKTGFTLLPPQTTGIFFTNFISDQRAVTNQNLRSEERRVGKEGRSR